MNFEKKYFTHSALTVAALMFAGCAAGTPSVSAENVVPETAAEVSVLAETPEPAAGAAETPNEETSSATFSRDAIEAELKQLAEETNALQLERSLIESRLALAASEQGKALAAFQLEKMQLDAEAADKAAKLSAEIAGIEEERAELERRLAFESARANAAFREKQVKCEKLEMESRELQAQMNREAMNTAFAVSVADKKSELSRLAPTAAQAPKYLKNPLVDGTLYISDRRVPLNGPITDELASEVCKQIYFYNNQSAEYPIFIVIDSSPGGSVAAGYQIMKAMQSCRAPVYVVVKKFAASMAAVIATTAERSFCYANSLILHHQISSGVEGNLTVMREGVAEGERWYKRFMGPVAEKMGISLEELTKEMYKHNSDGDWRENGVRAAELKWIDHVADRIEETGVVSILADSQKRPARSSDAGLEKTDSQGNRYVELPVLDNPFDFWAIYDKTDYYRSR